MAKKILLAGLTLALVVSWGALPALASPPQVEEEQAVLERLMKGPARQEHVGPPQTPRAVDQPDAGKALGPAPIGAKTARALAEEIAVLAIP